MSNLPYVSSPGNIAKALNGIKAAPVPETVGLDFVKTILKIPGGSGNQINSFLKKIGFAGQTGKPTELYTKFRNPSVSGSAAAEALKFAYAPLYARNEYAHELSDDELIGLIVEETGQTRDSNSVKLGATCFKNLRDFASFDAATPVHSNEKSADMEAAVPNPDNQAHVAKAQQFGLNLGYTINVNLPATSDQSVYNAIFKSIKENLLSSDDA